MVTRCVSCFVLDDYSSEEAIKIKIDENETIYNLMKIIKKKTCLENAKFLKVALSFDTLSNKLAFLEANPSANITDVLNGEELIASETTIFDYFDNIDCYIVIVPPFQFTFKKCIDEKILVPGDKMIYVYTNGRLIGDITATYKIRCYEDNKEYFLDSFSKFIKLAISPYNTIISWNWKNLVIELHLEENMLVWRDFRRRVLNDLAGTVKLCTFLHFYFFFYLFVISTL
jgi:hypothetical protein